MKKIVSFLIYFTLAMVAFTTFAFAYIDPSAMTYLIQIIASVVIACGATFAFYWRKLKRSVRKKKEEKEITDDSAEAADYAVEYADEEDIIDPTAADAAGESSEDAGK